jgi:Viral BACON domain
MTLHQQAILVGIILSIGLWSSPDAWALSASPTALTFQAVQGGTNPASQFINVSKPNNKTTNWAASDSATWVSVTPVTGSLTNSAQVGVAVNIAGLSAGTYSATVTVRVDKGGSVAIPVTLTVAPSTTTSLSTPTTSMYRASLTWDLSTDASVAGYKVYMGTTSGVYGTPITLANVTSYVLNNLPVATYYFVVTSYNANGTESLPSNEVSKSIY